ncbi:Mut7-C RNAse domain-containing protein [Desulfobacula sp.]|uniref:Mut7-C RNAse domain-containing protein n=1 Tax=Desulfobacula sp. TaxID=2593537 RepID=UPI002630686E|nr:Mut7-C RNAse domain-containing protein [Desulfobacula sp.]
MKIFIQLERQFDFFLTNDKNGNRFEYFLSRKASVKDIIESLGVPHTEVGRIDFNDQEVDFSYIPLSQGVLHVHAIHPPFTVLSPSVLRPIPLNSMKFIADVNVIKLGRLLILLGFDVNYSSFYSDIEIADIAETEYRIVLTRDTDLLKRKKIIFAKRIQANLPYDQLIETIIFFGLQNLISFFSRCTACNIKLVTTAKKDVIHLLEPKTKRYFNTFFQCPQCKRVFWKGSHYDNIQKKISSLHSLSLS